MTSSAVNGVPSCQVTPWRSLNVQFRPSGATVHDSARSDVGARSLPGRTIWLKSALWTIRFWICPIGGQVVMLAVTGSLKLPPRWAGAAAGAPAAGLAAGGGAAPAAGDEAGADGGA